jgi:hypothetical protein
MSKAQPKLSTEVNNGSQQVDLKQSQPYANSQPRQRKPFKGDRCPKHSQSQEPKSTMAASKWISKQSQPHARAGKCIPSTRPKNKELPIRVHQAINQCKSIQMLFCNTTRELRGANP